LLGHAGLVASSAFLAGYAWAKLTGLRCALTGALRGLSVVSRAVLAIVAIITRVLFGSCTYCAPSATTYTESQWHLSA